MFRRDQNTRILVNIYKWLEIKLKVQKNGIRIVGLVDTGADVTVISQKSWNPDWPLQKVNIQFLGLGTWPQIKQSTRWVECTGWEIQIGKLKSYVTDIAMNLWRCDLSWKAQISIPLISESNHNTKNISEKNY